MQRDVYSLDQALAGDTDFDAVWSAIPESYTVKGMFLSDVAKALGPDGWTALERDLLRAPRRGRYLPFGDYPQRDHFRMVLELARRRFPRLGTREALRQVARDDMRIFGESTVGKVMLAIAGTAATALMMMPEAYRRVVKGQRLEATRLAPDRVRIDVYEDYGGWEYNFGQIEGVAVHFGSTCTTTVEVGDPGYYAFELELG